MNLVDKFVPVVAIPPQAGAAITGDYISLKQANHVAVMVTINQANAATVAITIEQATDVSGTSSKALAKDVPIYLTADAATSDIPARQTNGVAYTTTADVKQKVVVFEIDVEDLDVTNGFDCITVKTGASNAANITSAMYLVGGTRYSGKSVIVD